MSKEPLCAPLVDAAQSLALVDSILSVIDSGLVGRKVRSHEERRWLFEEPIQSRMSPSIL